jgi:hypothetical protein
MDRDLVKKLLIGAGAAVIAIAGIYYLSRPVESREVVEEKPVQKPKKKKVNRPRPGEAGKGQGSKQA